MAWRVARREDHPSPARKVKAVAVLHVLVYPDGFEASLRPPASVGFCSSISGEGLSGLRVPSMGGIGGMREHRCSALAYESSPPNRRGRGPGG